jgi:hypothetical protein
MSKYLPPQCLECSNLREQPDHVGEKAKCEAFPDAIPDEIYFMAHPHNDSYPGDNGIQFKAKDK